MVIPLPFTKALLARSPKDTPTYAIRATNKTPVREEILPWGARRLLESSGGSTTLSQGASGKCGAKKTRTHRGHGKPEGGKIVNYKKNLGDK